MLVTVGTYPGRQLLTLWLGASPTSGKAAQPASELLWASAWPEAPAQLPHPLPPAAAQSSLLYTHLAGGRTRSHPLQDPELVQQSMPAERHFFKSDFF